MQMKQKATPQLRCWKVRLENTINVCNPKFSKSIKDVQVFRAPDFS
jgi:hypothetical protein